MMPGLGEKYEIEMEIISKPREEYQTYDYSEQGLPVAPAITVGEDILVEKSDISEKKLESVIGRHLGLPPPQPPKKGILGRFINK